MLSAYAMFYLRKSIVRYYSLLFTLASIIVICLILFLRLIKFERTDKVIFFGLMLFVLIFLIVYYIIYWIKKAPAVKYDNEGIYINSEFYRWKQVSSLNINYTAYITGINTIATLLNVDQQPGPITLYNFAYTNYAELMQYIATFQPQLLKTQATNVTSPIDYAFNKKYFSFNPFGVNVMALLFGIFLSMKILFVDKHYSFVSVFLFLYALLPILLFINSFQKIEISKGQLIIKKNLLPIKKCFDLQDISAIKYYTKGRGIKWLSIITKNYKEHRFFIDHFTEKKLYELKQDLQSFDILVVDTIFVGVSDANYKGKFTFTLSNKKRIPKT